MKLRDTILALPVVLLLCATMVHAQAQNQDSQPASPVSPLPPMDSGGGNGSGKTPFAAARGVSPAYDPEPISNAQLLPDNNTLSGAQQFGLGSLDHAHSIFDPSISFSELGRISTGTSGLTNPTSSTMFNGIVNFDRTWSRYHLSIGYNGGEIFNMGPASQNSFHNLSVSQQIDWERWHLILRDDFLASPGAAFGGTGMGGPGLIAQYSTMLGSLTNISGQAFVPAETIQTGVVQRYRNSVLGQAEYSFSRRSAFTFSGSYGLLNFPNAGYISSHMFNAQAGYDHLLDPTNSIAILASYGKIDYAGTTTSATNVTAAAAYGRKITGRMAFQVAAGPQQIRVGNGMGKFQHSILWVNSALSYEWRRSGVSLSYTRGFGAGSGVFLGATSNTFSGSGQYRFTRFWTGSVAGGYALNNSLAPAGVATTRFNNWFVGANLGRQVGPHAQINFNYGVQRQNSPAICPVVSCGGNGFQQTFGMTVNWHLRPAG
jgi:hypothetical protein